MKSYSQIGQDLLVTKYLNNKTGGYFVDIGCGFPTNINNTYLLEKQFNWSGLSLDIVDRKDPDGGSWSQLRPESNRVLLDALKVNYELLFYKYKVPKVVDYLSIDLEPPHKTLQCLSRIPFDKFIFNVITFETDEYRDSEGPLRAEKSRSFLLSKGYQLIKTIGRQDDLYLHKSITSQI